MKLPALDEVTDVLSGTLQYPAGTSRVCQTVSGIVLKITDGKGDRNTFPVQGIRTDIQVFTPGNAITVGLDLYG